MIRRPPRSTRTDTLLPYTTRFRAISGSVDVDSAIITMGNLPRGTMQPITGALVLAVPVVLNSLFKAGIAVSLGGRRHARQTASSEEHTSELQSLMRISYAVF